MSGDTRDKTKVDPLTGAEEATPAAPLQTKDPAAPANASTVEIPGTGEVIRDADGNEVKRVVTS